MNVYIVARRSIATKECHLSSACPVKLRQIAGFRRDVQLRCWSQGHADALPRDVLRPAGQLGASHFVLELTAAHANEMGAPLGLMSSQ